MSELSAFAPLIVLALVAGALRSGQAAGGTTLRDSFLGAALTTGVALALGTELLSVFGLLSRPAVGVFWVVAIAAAAVAFVHRRRKLGRPARLRMPDFDLVDVALLSGIAAIAFLLLVVAWLAPPQSSDALSYHLGRVMHWAQNGSVAPYPTYDSRQLYHPPFAEMVQLHLYLLSGSDRGACLLQWFAAMLSLLAVSKLARDIGADRRTQIFAALVAVTIPIGITQATSAKNGWTETLWLLSLACFSGAFANEAPSRARIVGASAALGLALMTKLTSWLFAGPVVIVAAARLLRRNNARELVVPLAAGAALVCALTLPFLVRNVSVYGNPVVDPVGRARSGLEYVTPAVVASNAVRNAFFQLGTGSPAVNDVLMSIVLGAHRWIGADPFDERTSQFDPFRISPPTRIEELVYSPLHILLLLGAGVALVVSRRLRSGRGRAAYLAVIGAGYVLFCAAVTWQAPNCRLLMPLLVLASPFTAVAVAEAIGARLVPVIAAVLFAAAVPYAARTEWRPLSMESKQGVLVTPRKDLYFARFPHLRRTYEEVAREVHQSRTRNLGVVYTHAGDPEYLLWVLLQGADPPVRIEHVLVGDASGRLSSEPRFRDFRPELVVVFASDARTPRFEQEIPVGAARLRLARSAGNAAFYRPARDAPAR